MKKRWVIPVIISASVLFIIASVILGIFIAKKTARSRALSALDVENEQSVTNAMRYIKSDASEVIRIARLYADADMQSDAVRLTLYAIQYLGAKDEGVLLLKSIGVSEQFYSQFEHGVIPISEFESVTSFENDSYGIADGIYAEFLGGHAKAKLSPALPLDICAYDGGAYFLDSSDRLIKSISKDGRELRVIINQKAREFEYLQRQIYYIDEQGLPHGSEDVMLADGEFAAGLYVEGDNVKCTIYNQYYEPLRLITLK